MLSHAQPAPQVRAARLFLGLVLAALGGCAEDGGTGAVTVTWSIGGSTCNQSGVSKMLVSLYLDGDLVQSEEGSCIAGSVRVEGVSSGTYLVEVTAYRDDSSDPAYVGTVSGVVVPKGGAVNAPNVELEEAPGALDLQWRFESGQLCRFAGIVSVEVGVFDIAGRRAAQRKVPCNPELSSAATAAPPGASYLKDAKGIVFDRLLPGPYTVSVFAYGAGSSALPSYYGNADAVVEVYKLGPVEVVLKACPEGSDSPCL